MSKYQIFKSARNKLQWQIATDYSFDAVERFNRIDKYILDNFEQPLKRHTKFRVYSKVD